MIYPRQSGSMSSMDMSSMDMSMPGMSTMTGMASNPTMTMDSNSSSNGGLKLSPAVIATLAVIGGAVVSIFVGFWIHARIREYKLKKHPHAHQLTSSVSTYVGAAPSTLGGTLATSSYSRLEKTVAPPMPADYEEKQPAKVMPSIPTDPTGRLAPQRLPGKDTATGAEVKEAGLTPPNPQFAAHPYGGPYLEGSMQQTNLSTPAISPPPGNLTPRSPPLPYIAPGGMPKANDAGYDSTTLVGGRPAPSASPRPLPRIPQLARTASLLPSSGPPPSGDRSFLTFDDAAPHTRGNVLQPDVPDAAQRQPDQSIITSTSTSFRSTSSSGVRLMTVIMDYDPELPDELEVKEGDTVRILREYDDGWCVIEHLSRPKKRPGAIPRMCLQERSAG